ncbi:lysyl oxidase family protein [Nocardioides sp.]|uniref:lysyl oxidase family protein n=1 Tax=Nocardioides sp. TaxID=35761 RepID=UPI002ED34247
MQLRSLLATGLAVSITAVGLAATQHTAGADEPAPLPDSAIALTAPKKVIAYGYRGRIYSGLGLRLVAGDAPVEIWSKRESYDDPITSVWRTEGGDVPLPAGANRGFRGLKKFARLKITRVADGAVMLNKAVQVCLNGSSQRIHPGAPARSPYPWGCPWNSYTVGSVMGIESGWSTSMLDEWRRFRLPKGRYDVEASISPAYADLFDISPEESATKTRLVVREEENFEGRGRRSARPSGASSGPALRPAPKPTADFQGALAADGAPDLRSLPAFDISINEKGTAIRFAANVWNGGEGPMVVDGFRAVGGDHMDAYQYFFDGDGNQTGYDKVGEFHFHEGNHQHWHFGDFARYRLLNADQSLAVRSTKASFCLANTDAVDYTIPNADWQPENTDLSSDCGGADTLSLRQVLSNGSGDTYHQYRTGQAFRIGNLPDGDYYISVEANPDDRRDGRNLIEGDYTNNDSLRKITIGTNKKGKRWVRAEQVGQVIERMPRFY